MDNYNQNNRIITKITTEFEVLDSEIDVVLTSSSINFSTSNLDVLDKMLSQIKSRITSILGLIMQLYRLNDTINYKNGDNNFPGDVLVITLFNSLLYKTILKVIQAKTLDFNAQTIILNRLVYDNESVYKRLDAVVNLLSTVRKEED